MSKLEKEVLKNIIKFMNISNDNVLELNYINSVGYSLKKLSEIKETLKDKNINFLKDITDDSEELNNDIIFIYKVILLGNKTYFVVFIDPFELYDSMYIESIFEI
jgi:hypothetical protein